MEILAKKIGKLTLLKIYFIGLFIPLLLVGLIFGICAFFGYSVVLINGNIVTGIYGFFGGTFIGIVLSLFFTLFLWLLSLFGLWVFSLFSPIKLKLTEYK